MKKTLLPKMLSVCLLIFLSVLIFTACDYGKNVEGGLNAESGANTGSETEAESIMSKEEIDAIVKETGLTGEKLAGGRTVKPISEPKSEPIEIVRKNFSTNSFKIKDGVMTATTTSDAYLKRKTGDGSYMFQCSIEGKADQLQLFFNLGTGSAHVLVAVAGNSVTIERTDYHITSAYFEGSSEKYCIRVEVYPSAGCVRVYMNGQFTAEVNVGESDYPLIENSAVRIVALGAKINLTVSDIYLENIGDIEPRRYDGPGVTADGEELFPKSENAPADTVYYVNTASLSADDLLTLLSLQGLVNRKTPQIYANYSSYNQDPAHMNIAGERAYRDLIKESGREMQRAELDELLVKFSDCYDGVITGSPYKGKQVRYEENIITTLCGVLDSVYMSKSHYKKLHDDIGKEIIFDTADRFEGDVDAYMWLYRTFGSLCSDKVLFHAWTMKSTSNGHYAEMSRDYAVMTRAFTFCATGIETLEDYEFYMELFASRPANTAVMGYSAAQCIDEFYMFRLCGQFGKYFIYSFSTPNLSFFNNFEHGELKQKEAEETGLESNTVYAAFDLSEGDNLSWDWHIWAERFTKNEEKDAPAKNYSFCGAMYYLAPAVLEYYYKNARQCDYFFLDGGGIGNIGSPDDFALLYKDGYRKDAVSQMLRITEYTAKQTDTTVLRALWSVSDGMTRRYASECHSIKMLISSYGNQATGCGGYGGDYSNSLYQVNGLLRSKATFSNFAGALSTFVKPYIKKYKNSDEIYFAETFVYTNAVFSNYSVGLGELQKQLGRSGLNVVPVRADVFAELYAQYGSK